MIPRSPPEIRLSPGLRLRGLTLDDAADVLAYASDPEFGRFIRRPAATLEEAAAFIASTLAENRAGQRLYWGVELDGRLRGTIGFLNLDKEPGTLELGFGIARELWGRGIINACLQALIELAFGDLEALKLIISTHRHNARSIAFARKFGFRPTIDTGDSITLSLERPETAGPPASRLS